MSNVNTSSLIFAAQQVTIYMGIPTLIAGLIGEILNCIVFLSLKTFRENSCAFYLTIMSFVNIGQLLTSLLPRIMINGFDIDWTHTSSFYCKFRIYILQLSTLMSATCMCLATIDQFFATCFNPRWQRWSNIKVAHRMTIICAIICLLHGILYWIFYDHIDSPITGRHTCMSTNEIFQQYHVLNMKITFLITI